MSTYSQIAWLPLCGGLSGLGLVLSWLIFRRRGFGAGLRGVAWSLLPLAAYLTGAIEMIWKIGVAIGDFATSFVFSPEKWAGVALTGLIFVLFVVTGFTRRGRAGRGEKASDGGRTLDSQPASRGGKPGQPAKSKALETRTGKRAAAAADDDDFSEIEKILKNRGIS